MANFLLGLFPMGHGKDVHADLGNLDCGDSTRAIGRDAAIAIWTVQGPGNGPNVSLSPGSISIYDSHVSGMLTGTWTKPYGELPVAHSCYAAPKRRQREPGPRRMIADFLIGGLAFQNGFSFLTLEVQFFRAAFPRLALAEI